MFLKAGAIFNQQDILHKRNRVKVLFELMRYDVYAFAMVVYDSFMKNAHP